MRGLYHGYEVLFLQSVTELSYAARVGRKFLQTARNHSSELAEQALPFFTELYDIER
ncbi:transposase [Caballeronia peredens]|nr:transposase IS66 [Burkholderia sp. SJ98]SAL77535.1 transposase [Caballeronia peredens]